MNAEKLDIFSSSYCITKMLQQDLRTLGFSLVGSVDGIYGWKTTCAVREFQLYAKMPFVAKEIMNIKKAYIGRLYSVKNTQAYTGPITGELNNETLEILQHWKMQQWRCPVVISAYRASKNISYRLAENVWWHDELKQQKCQVYAYDFSGYYSPHASEDLSPSPDKIGQSVFDPFRHFQGPVSLRSQSHINAEMSPENLLGKSFTGLTAEELSTYKVIRAVAEVECLGRFDSINAYDNAFVSLGPCHWTLGITPPMTEGELCGYFAYLQYADPIAYEKALGHFGIEINKTWSTRKNTLFNPSQRKYTAWFKNMPLTESVGNYFRTWHWFYRFMMAARTVEGFRRKMWDMACIRIKDILTTPFPESIHHYDKKNLTIGDVFTSEKSVTMLLRWHIRFPNDVVSNGHAGKYIVQALLNRHIPTSAGNPDNWQDENELQLIQSLDEQITLRGNRGLRETLNQVINEKDNLRLNHLRNSFLIEKNYFEHSL